MPPRKPLKSADVNYGEKLKQIMSTSAKGDEKLLEYIPMKYRSQGTGIVTGISQPESIARRMFKEFGKDQSFKGNMMRYRALYTPEAMCGFIAYTVMPVPVLHAFCIGIQHRNDTVKKAFIKLLDEDIFEGIPYGVVLHKSNIRAIRFFENQGFRQTPGFRRQWGVMLCKGSLRH